MPDQEFRADTDALVTYKGFDAAFRCRNHQFEVGGSYFHTGPVAACEAGFHACEYPLDVFAYYPPGTSRYAIVEQYGHIGRHADDSKIASAGLTVHGEIGIADLVSEAIAHVTGRCDAAHTNHATGYRSASSATGYSSASSATGYSSASSATGHRSASSATGYSSASSATGYSSASSATGDRSASSATGDRSASSATGDSSASSATGDRSASSATGDRSASSATGDRSASLCTGAFSASEIRAAGDGRALHAVAIATGYQSKARAPAGSALCLVHRDSEGTIVAIRAAKVGDAGIQPDTWYRLSATGELEEVAD